MNRSKLITVLTVALALAVVFGKAKLHALGFSAGL
jgi:hypothetical protein